MTVARVCVCVSITMRGKRTQAPQTDTRVKLLSGRIESECKSESKSAATPQSDQIRLMRPKLRPIRSSAFSTRARLCDADANDADERLQKCLRRRTNDNHSCVLTRRSQATSATCSINLINISDLSLRTLHCEFARATCHCRSKLILFA